jgi:hypothetical protein
MFLNAHNGGPVGDEGHSRLATTPSILDENGALFSPFSLFLYVSKELLVPLALAMTSPTALDLDCCSMPQFDAIADHTTSSQRLDHDDCGSRMGELFPSDRTTHIFLDTKKRGKSSRIGNQGLSATGGGL